MGSGHGASLSIEVDPVGAPNVFTTVGKPISDFLVRFTVASTDITAHDDNIDVYVPEVLRRDTVAYGVIFDPDSPTHTALRNHMLNRRTFKSRLWGPGGSAGVDEMILSGFLESWQQSSPNEGRREGEGVYRPSGSMTINGVPVG